MKTDVSGGDAHFQCLPAGNIAKQFALSTDQF